MRIVEELHRWTKTNAPNGARERTSRMAVMTAVGFPLVEAWLREQDIEFVSDEVQIKDLRTHPSGQIRSSSNAETFPGLLASFQSGRPVPAIVVDTGLQVVDGNTRLAAAREAGLDSLPAIVADFKDDLQRIACQGAANQMNGEKLTEDEVALAARMRLRAGDSLENVAADLLPGRATSTLSDAVRAYDTKERLAMIPGAKIPAGVAKGSLVALSWIDADEDLLLASRAIERAPIASAAQIRDLAKSIKGARSRATRQQVADDWVTTVNAVVPATRNHRNRMRDRSPAARVSGPASAVLAYGAEEVALTATPETRALIRRLRRWIDDFEKVQS